jgi:adenylate cyclase
MTRWLDSRWVSAPSVTAAALLCTLALYYAEVRFIELLELRTYDLRLQSRGPIPPYPGISIAVIDEASLDAEGRWPWRRSRIAALVDRLSEAGARVIAFDIGFIEPDAAPERAVLDEIIEQVDHLGIDDPALGALLAERRAQADTDGALARAIARSPARVVLGYFFHESGAAGLDISTDELDRQLGLIETSAYAIQLADAPERSPFPRALAPEGNLPVLTEVAASSGTFTLRQDPDGIVRRMPLAIQCGPLEEVFPPIAVLAAWHYLGEPPMSVEVDRFGVVGVRIGEQLVPTDEGGRLLLNFVGPPHSFPFVSAARILAGEADPALLRDRVVLVGATATGTYDMRSTPFSTVFPGVEIHATAIDNILSGRFLEHPGWADVYDVAAIFVVCALSGLLLPRVGAIAGGLLTIALLATHLAVARELLVRTGVPVAVVHPAIGLLLCNVGLTAYAYLAEQRERRKVTSAFGQYVSPDVIDRILADPSSLELGGQEKELSVLFSDLQGFTSSSERYSPSEMTRFLGEYYGRMTEEIFEQGGMLKEYVGDELMAIFGAPVDQPDHARRACATALAMRRTRQALSREWVTHGRPALFARTGVNSGVMLVGNIGSEYRMSYGAVGDQVNLGSRLEGMNKQYGSEILIGENTAALVGDAFPLREIDQVRVVGKDAPTRIFELLDPEEPFPEAALAAYRAGLEAYRARVWSDAERLFRSCREQQPDDGPAAVMAERCRQYAAAPPDEDWDGVYEARLK